MILNREVCGVCGGSNSLAMASRGLESSDKPGLHHIIRQSVKLLGKNICKAPGLHVHDTFSGVFFCYPIYHLGLLFSVPTSPVT